MRSDCEQFAIIKEMESCTFQKCTAWLGREDRSIYLPVVLSANAKTNQMSLNHSIIKRIEASEASLTTFNTSAQIVDLFYSLTRLLALTHTSLPIGARRP